MTQKKTITNIGTLLCTLAVLTATGCRHNERANEPIIPAVTVADIESEGDEYSISYPGLVKAAQELSLSFRVSGTIDRILVSEGDHVKKGQVLARLDTSDYRNQLNATTAEYEAIIAEAGRVVDLYNEEATTRSNYDKAVSGMKQIESKLQFHRNQLDYCTLYAPIDGVIGTCNRSEHENVSAGMAVVQMLSNGSPEIEIHISDKIYISRDKITSYTCRLSIYPDEVFTLTPISYSSSANSNQLYTVRLRIENTGKRQILKGMNATVTATVGTGSSSMSVPTRSIVHDATGDHILLVGPDCHVTTASVRVIDVQKSGRCRIEALPIDTGYKVITSAVGRIEPGDTVRPIATTSETNIGGIL